MSESGPSGLFLSDFAIMMIGCVSARDCSHRLVLGHVFVVSAEVERFRMLQ